MYSFSDRSFVLWEQQHSFSSAIRFALFLTIYPQVCFYSSFAGSLYTPLGYIASVLLCYFSHQKNPGLSNRTSQDLLGICRHAAVSFIYPQTLSRISVSALPLLVWLLTTSALQRSASATAHRTILCDTVLVKRMIRSGDPIWFPSFAGICVNTFALQLCSLQIFFYWQTMRSCPPIITTLM